MKEKESYAFCCPMPKSSCFKYFVLLIVAFCERANSKSVNSSWLQLILEVKVWEINLENEEAERKSRAAAQTSSGTL